MKVDLLIDISEDKRRTKTLNFLRDAHKYGYYFPSDTRQALTDKRQRRIDNEIIKAESGKLPRTSNIILHFFYNSITNKGDINITNIKTIRTYPQYKKTKILKIKEI